MKKKLIRLTESDLHRIVKMSVNRVITESQESRSIHAAKQLVMQKLGCDEQQADRFVRINIRQAFPSLRSPEGGKYVLGVTRMYCDGDLNDRDTQGDLEYVLKNISSNGMGNYDRNLNGMSAQELIDAEGQNDYMQSHRGRQQAERDWVSKQKFEPYKGDLKFGL